MTEQATTTPPAKDWREFVEERTEYGDKVLDANCYNGKWYGLVESQRYPDDVQAVAHALVLKPKPKTTRPWTPDEVPVGAVVKNGNTGAKSVIISFDGSNQVWVASSGWIMLKTLHKSYLLELTRPSGSTPGSYGVCGVEE